MGITNLFIGFLFIFCKILSYISLILVNFLYILENLHSGKYLAFCLNIDNVLLLFLVILSSIYIVFLLFLISFFVVFVFILYQCTFSKSLQLILVIIEKFI